MTRHREEANLKPGLPLIVLGCATFHETEIEPNMKEADNRQPAKHSD